MIKMLLIGFGILCILAVIAVKKVNQFNHCLDKADVGMAISELDNCFGWKMSLDAADKAYFSYSTKSNPIYAGVVVYQAFPGWPDIAVIGFDKDSTVFEKKRWQSP